LFFLENGRRLYTTQPVSQQLRAVRGVSLASPTFLKSASSRADFPPDVGREIAFVGRSNSGKSTALNLITGVRKLARVSKTPGRTQLVNFFEVGPDRRLVDLPGYGFARVAPGVREHWRRLLESYFSTRSSLAGLVLTVDIRRGWGPLDAQMVAWTEPLELPIAVLLTKADKLSRGAGLAAERGVAKQLAGRSEVLRFSAIDRLGVVEARARLEGWFSEGEPI
jgi:GTP-binding protein